MPSFLRRLFPRKRAPLPPINEDWQVGDLAECVCPEGYAWRRRSDGTLDEMQIADGDVQRVTDVYCIEWLMFAATGERQWHASGFRKVPETNSAADAEFTAKIRRHARKPVSA